VLNSQFTEQFLPSTQRAASCQHDMVMSRAVANVQPIATNRWPGFGLRLWKQRNLRCLYLYAFGMGYYT
jgi:hypothetical protein